MVHRFLLLLLTLAALPAVTLTPVPKKLLLEVTFLHPETSAETTATVEAVFEKWPHQREGARKAGEWEVYSLLPTELREVEFEKLDEAGTTWRWGRHTFTFPFEAFAILPSQKGRDQQFAAPVGRPRETDEVIDLDEEDEAAAEAAKAAAATSPVSLETDLKLPHASLPLAQVLRMKSLYPAGWDGKVKGRYLRYHQSWKGTGKVRPARATFFGGSGEDEFVANAVLADGSILAVGHVGDAAFLTAHPTTAIGTDPGADTETAIEVQQGKRKRRIALEQRAPVIVRFDRDLTRVEQVLRLPFRCATIASLVVEDADTAYLALRTRPNVERLLDAVPVAGTVAPDEGADTRFGSVILKLSLRGKLAIEWALHLPGRGIGIGPRQGPEILAWAGSRFWTVRGDGAIAEGPVLQPGSFGGHVAASGVDDSIYIGSMRFSGTGREPWKCPRLRHYGGDGRLRMSLYDWSGPVVGLDQSRQVSDSLGMRIWADAGGDFVVAGKSDGGNTCYANVPYDITRHHNKYGAIKDMSAASLAAFTSLLRISSKTHDVTGATWIIGYHPILDYPVSGAVDDIAELDNGLFAAACGFSYGMIETQDCWFPTFLQRKADPILEVGNPRGGSALCVFSKDLQKMVFSSIVPNVKPMRISAQGNRILITGSSPEHGQVYEDAVEPIIVEPIQQGHGGGDTDAYILLVDTEGAR